MMTQAKWDALVASVRGATEGPWEVEPDHNGRLTWVRTNVGRGIARADNNNEPNATLIAAAPTLLQECIALRAAALEDEVEIARLEGVADDYAQEAETATAQRDQLAEALRDCIGYIESDYSDGDDIIGGAKDSYAQALAALAALEVTQDE